MPDNPVIITKWKEELNEIDKKICQLTKELLAIPDYNDKFKYRMKIATIKNEYSANPTYEYNSQDRRRLHEKYPNAFIVVPRRNDFYIEVGIYLLSPNLNLVVQSEINYLYNRKLQVQKYIDKALSASLMIGVG